MVSKSQIKRVSTLANVVATPMVGTIFTRHDIPLGENRAAALFLPNDLTLREVERLAKYMRAIASV